MENKIIELKEKLRNFGTRELLGMISMHFITFANDAEDVAEQSDIFNKTDLMSPQKQYLYLAGLLMSTDDRSDGITNDSSDKYKDLENDVQDITFEYLKNFIDFDFSLTNHNPDIVKRNLVSMEAFTSYFDTGILRYDEQTESLMKSLYSPFDNELYQLTSLTVNDLISFYHFISEIFSDALHKPKEVMKRITDFLETLNPDAVDLDKEYQRMLDFGTSGIGDDLQMVTDGLNTIQSSTIIEKFGEQKGNSLIEAFSLYRKERKFSYYNGKNPFTSQPLCWLDDGQTLFIVHPQFVLNAIFNFITEILEVPQNSFAERYKKAKADIVENMFLTQLKCIFGDTAKFHVSVCEERGTKEHDIVIEFENYIIIAEVKASKVREPFFNPDKAYTRVRDHFNSDSGIGGAYQQAITLKKLFEATDNITLYENKTSSFNIGNISEKIILPIVFTLNQFGGIAVNASMLIEKEEGQPYPWICNLHDFENIIEINKYLNKTPHDLVEYIIWRMSYHRQIISSDELDVIEGYYLDSHLKSIKDENIFFPPNGPSLIDKIYFEKQGMAYFHPMIDRIPRRHKKIGVNEPCPCGSGNKFKRCCRGNGIYD